MDFDLDAIPDIESAGRLGRVQDADPSLVDAYRSFRPDAVSPFTDMIGHASAERLARLRSVFGVGAESGINLSEVRDVGAAAVSYTTHSDCGGFNYTPTCTEACFGFEPQHMDPFYCGTCAEQAADPANNPSFNWHYVGSRGSFQYIDMPVNACNGKDAWKWQIEGACGECSRSAWYRCHDGYKKYPDENFWTPTICQGIVTCDDQLKSCP